MSDLTFDEIREKLNKVLRFGVFTTNAEQYVTGLFEVVIQRAEAAEARVAELEAAQQAAYNLGFADAAERFAGERVEPLIVSLEPQ